MATRKVFVERYVEQVRDGVCYRGYVKIEDDLSSAEACEIAKVSKPMMLHYLKVGKINGYQVGSHWRVKKDSLLKFIEDRESFTEMNPEQLWETTMNPKTRMLKKVTIEDGTRADEIFSKLMGDEVEHRKQFIAERAHEAQIDI
jgi:excisionase family DNA binding protein